MSTSAEYVRGEAGKAPSIAMREPVIETRGLRKEFDGFVAVAGVDLRFAGTGVFGIIGPNGAGKTTFFNLLSSFLKPSSGKVLFHDQDISRLNPQAVFLYSLTACERGIPGVPPPRVDPVDCEARFFEWFAHRLFTAAPPAAST